MTDADNTPHISNLRSIIMLTLAAYAKTHDDVEDTHMVGALAAGLCDALIIKGMPLDDEVLDTIRKTYDLCEIQHAMMDKENNSVQ